jgi:DNA-binding GntR family transcriptional regulator
MATGTPRPAPAKDRAYAFVKERILDGAYPGGELLSEGEVAEALEVSRTPVREAFLLLEAEGLMRLYPKRGALVVPVSPDEIRDVMETRMLIERHAADRLARSGASAKPVLHELREILQGQQQLLEAGDMAGFVASDRAFHHTIVAASGNAILSRISDSLRDRQRRMVAVTVARDPALPRRFLAEHQEILAAIAAGDGDTAASLVEAHLARSRARIEGASREAAAT